MRILFLEAYYKPEKTSGAHLAEDMRQALVSAGHTLQIYAPTPSRGVTEEIRREYAKRRNETESSGKICVHRFPLYREGRRTIGRALRYALLEMQLLWFGLIAKDVDLLPMGSTPPINGLMATVIKKLRKIPFVYTVQDLFPESLVNTGMTREGSLLCKIGSWVSNVTYRNATHICVISESIRDALISKGVPAEKISVIRNWIDTDVTVPVAREDNTLFDEFSLSRDAFYVTYAGNLGNSQNVELIVDCAQRLQEYSDIRFVVFGDGSEKNKLQERINTSGLSNIQLFPMQPMARISEVYSLGDVSMVTCKAGVGKGAFPSKAASIMATGTAVIASFDEDSDLCRMLRQAEAGVCVEAENVPAAAEAILRFYKDRGTGKAYGENGRKFACQQFSKQTEIAKKVAVFEAYSKQQRQ